MCVSIVHVAVRLRSALPGGVRLHVTVSAVQGLNSNSVSIRPRKSACAWVVFVVIRREEKRRLKRDPETKEPPGKHSNFIRCHEYVQESQVFCHEYKAIGYLGCSSWCDGFESSCVC